jgi:hypothetical protein
MQYNIFPNSPKIISLSTKQIASLLNLNYRQTAILAKQLNWPYSKSNHYILFNFPINHPFIRSISQHTNSTKIIYSISDISNIWQHKKGFYSTDQVKRLLLKLNIPLYNQNTKARIYLSDLVSILKSF